MRGRTGPPTLRTVALAGGLAALIAGGAAGCQDRPETDAPAAGAEGVEPRTAGRRSPDGPAAAGAPAPPSAAEGGADQPGAAPADGAADSGVAACLPSATVGCGQTVTGDTTGRTGLVGAPACGVWDETGPEVAYTFDPGSGDPGASARSARLSLTSLEADLDLFVLEGACSVDRCAGWSATLDDELVEVDLRGGGPWFVIVDGFDGAAGPYTLAVECGEGPAEICDDGRDNDGDQAVDCADPACADAPACTRPDDAYEPNDSLAEAAAGVEGEVTGLTVHGGDDDWFAVPVCPGGTVTAAIGFDAAAADLDVILLDGDRRELASSFGSTGDETLTWTNDGAADRTVYVVVTSFYGESGRYDLSLRVTGC